MSNNCKTFVQRVAGMRCECKPSVRIHKGKPKFKLIETCLACDAQKLLRKLAQNARHNRVKRTRQLELPIKSEREFYWWR